MSPKTLIILVVLLYSRPSRAQDEDAVLCSASFCATYIDSSPCSSIPEECKIQNSTSNGVILPSNDPCNCCTFCLVNLKKGEYCSAGDIGSAAPDSICGPGLTCDGTLSICVEMVDNTECARKRNDYDTRRQSGTLGALEVRPNCDSDGYYEPYVCIPEQNCFCVDPEGARIFGETSYAQTASLTMKCECSRKYEAARAFLGLDLDPNQFFRCVDNGDYDTIQCIGDNCMCTDPSDGAPTFPTRSFVNVTLISNKTLEECFKPGVHLEKTYHYPCAVKYFHTLAEIETYKEEDGFDAVFDVVFPKCDINGKYAPVQESEGYAYCVDFDGTQIETYKITSEEKKELEKNNKNMNCHCARTRLLLDNTQEELGCCSNGNFNPIQCRRGVCYCVDDNGYQNIQGDLEENEVGVEEQEKLHCYENSINYCKT